jgi:hypothetical protein
MVSSAFSGLFRPQSGDPAARRHQTVLRGWERHDGLTSAAEMRRPKKILLQRPGSGTVNCRRRLELSRRM